MFPALVQHGGLEVLCRLKVIVGDEGLSLFFYWLQAAPRNLD